MAKTIGSVSPDSNLWNDYGKVELLCEKMKKLINYSSVVELTLGQ